MMKLFPVIWAIGPLNQRFEVSYHSQFLKEKKKIDFGRQPFWNCPAPLFSDTLEDDNKKGRPQSQKLNQQHSNRSNETIKQQQPVSRPVPTPKPVAKRDAWEIPPIQCNG